MKPVEMKDGVWWVGGIDWDLRNFHGYLTQRGTTYNSFLIMDEKIVLIDNVKHYLFEEMIERISHIINPAKIDYIVQNHVEMDHSGSLPEMKKIVPNATIITSPKGAEGLEKHYHSDWDYKVVKSGDTLNIGTRNLAFLLTPMVHWPDNMVTYCPDEKILFSNDAFGQHIASSERFDDEYPFNLIMEEARKYYANIVLPYAGPVNKALTAAAELDIEMIAPSHGILWRKHIPELMAKYHKWAANIAEEKAIIIYDTMWKSTEKMAYAIKSGFDEKGIPVKMCNLQANHISDIMTDLIDTKYICIGSSTLNNNILPTVAAFLTYMMGLAPKGRIGMAFGSYGWGGQSVGQIEVALTNCGFDLMKQHRLQYVPTKEQLQHITQSVIEELNNQEEK
ncbi:MAG: FprA family A-type flavoprotein [Candidatus Cloacimonetes bacterium]|nr:FprA family A-type flavoprotein [Candidatus Cloacimonadota bacterium]